MKLLVIDDDQSFCESLEEFFKVSGHAVESAYDAAQGMQRAHRSRPDCILLDWNLPDTCGKNIIQSLKRSCPVPIIMLSALPDVHNVVAALKEGADNFLFKPVVLDELLSLVQLTPLKNQATETAPKTQREMKLRHFEEALKRHGGHKSNAAKELGITRQTLAKWIKGGKHKSR